MLSNKRVQSRAGNHYPPDSDGAGVSRRLYRGLVPTLIIVSCEHYEHGFIEFADHGEASAAVLDLAMELFRRFGCLPRVDGKQP